MAEGTSGRQTPMVTRRTFLTATVAAAGAIAGSGAVIGVPTIWAQKLKDLTLMQVGGSYSAIIDIARQATKDLGITITMQNAASDAVVNRVATQPQSLDIVDLEHWMLVKVLPRGVLQGVDLQRFRRWEEVVPIFTKGEYPDGRPVSRQGTSPYEVQYLEQPDAKRFARSPTRWGTMIPTLYNADTLGLRPDLVKRPIEHWYELLSPEFKGRAALLDVPSIGIMDAAMAIESRGDVKYADKGNMTPAEIDKTMKILIDLKKAGHFRAFWTTFDESVNLMASGEVVIQSMWSPAVTAVRARGIPCHYVPLQEGYRAWAVGLGMMRHVKGLKLDAAYEYLNWYLSGWQGGFIALFAQQRTGDVAGAFLRSLTLALLVLVLTVVMAVMAGLAFRRRFIGASLLYLAIASLVMPGLLAGLGIGLMYQLIGIQPDWYSSALGAQLTWTLPFGLLIMFAVFSCFNRFYEEAARDLGASAWQAFRHVVLPILLPGIIGMALFGFTLSYDEFARTMLTVGPRNTLPLEIWAMTTNVTSPALYALGTLTTAVSFVVISLALSSMALVQGRRARRTLYAHKYGTDLSPPGEESDGP